MKLRQDLGDFSQQSDFKKATKILTEIKKSFQSVVALNKQTGDLVWEKPIEGYIPRTERPEDFYDLRKSIRLAATEDEVFVRGVKTIAAFDAKNGDELWSRDSEPDFNIANPIIIDSNVYISDLSDSSIIAIDIKSGDELWRSKVPDCSFYVREEY
jgi:outer membrane protein assembly factor BamB